MMFPKGRHGLGVGLCHRELSVRLWGLGCLRVAAEGVGECLSLNMGAAEMSGQGFYSARGGSAGPAGEEMLGRVVQVWVLLAYIVTSQRGFCKDYLGSAPSDASLDRCICAILLGSW